MPKHGSQNWRKVPDDVWREFKARCVMLNIKVYDAQTEAIKLFLDKHKGE